uniref:Uncharacterized protein n=1 Tax=Grammatophora oceanica TaxID=210454 RepID=A0A7S1UX94_9STRA|mmetsp:Transcript_24994/g.36598  ORF Transcript_24994/g.36598 Transcript_24994/m.36598 type:complete len:160 (+) Transcript_24994:31-510(+)
METPNPLPMIEGRTEDKCYRIAASSIPDAQNQPAGFGIFTTNPEGGRLKLSWSKGIYESISVKYCFGETQDPMQGLQSSIQEFVDLGSISSFHAYLRILVFEDNDVYTLMNFCNRTRTLGLGLSAIIRTINDVLLMTTVLEKSSSATTSTKKNGSLVTF